MSKIIVGQNNPSPKERFVQNSYEVLADTLRSGFGISITLQQTKDGEFVISDDTEIFVLADGARTKNIAGSTLAELMLYEHDGRHIAAFDHILGLFSVEGASALSPGHSPHSFLAIHCGSLSYEKERLDFLLEKISWLNPSKYLLVGLPPEAAHYLRSKIPSINLAPALTSDIVCVPNIAAALKAVAAQKNILRENVVIRYVYLLKKILSFPMSKVFYLFYKKILELPLLHLMEYIEGKTGTLITYQLRPLYAKDFTDVPDTLIEPLSCAIVMQGPLIAKNDFTLETIRLYKKIFPGLPVILSTWEGEDLRYLKRIAEEHIEVLLNKKPAWNGLLNVNLQMTSSRNGIQKAKDMGAQYVAKTRTDQRIYNKNILESMINLLQYFPPSERSQQRKRMLFLHNAGKYAPYAFSDILTFGDADDQLEYWGAPLLEEGVSYTFFTPETYLATEFLRKKGWVLDYSIESWWNICRECIITMDWTMIDLYFYKYDHVHHMQLERNYKIHIPSEEHLQFTDWFNIFSNLENKRHTPQQTIHMRGFSAQKQKQVED